LFTQKPVKSAGSPGILSNAGGKATHESGRHSRPLRFYFITDDGVMVSRLDQVRVAVEAGATMVQYRNKSFPWMHLKRSRPSAGFVGNPGCPFVVNDNVLLARAVGADGVHVGQDDAPPRLARRVMGPRPLSVCPFRPWPSWSTDLAFCDYIGTGPTFPTGTKADAKSAHGLSGLRDIVNRSPLPAVAIGGIGPVNARGLFCPWRGRRCRDQLHHPGRRPR
jgi:thiamine-phosphate pyrophosphorylase